MSNYEVINFTKTTIKRITAIALMIVMVATLMSVVSQYDAHAAKRVSSKKSVTRKVSSKKRRKPSKKTAKKSGSKTRGRSAARYAKKFIGNPYVYGGTSLTRGADCSGFVMSVYKRYGVNLPHAANYMTRYGKSVPYSKKRAGDVICFPGHVGIYIGNGRIVHAMCPRYGITVSKIGYNGKPVVAVRRMV